MSNSLKYFDAWKSYRATVRAARDRYERELARLEPYRDSKRGAEQMEEAKATFEGELEAARAVARPAFSAALKAMREHVGKPSMTPPSAEQLATLQALELRTDLENGEIEAAAEIMRGNDLAMRTLRDVAKRKGHVVPAGMATIAEQATEAVEKLGPYIVIAPGLALGHARPNESVHAPCIAIATLDEPVEFGSKDNDPVDIVVVLAAVDDNAHIALLQKMVLFLNEEGAFEKLRAARTRQEAQDIADAINKEA